MGLFAFRMKFEAGVPSEAAFRAALLQQVGSASGLDAFEVEGNSVLITTALEPVTQPYAIKVLQGLGGTYVDSRTG